MTDQAVPTELPVPPLAVPVPPMLEAAIGVPSGAMMAARYIAFYWSPMGDEIMFTVGNTGGTATGWMAWLAYTRHKAVAPILAAALPPFAFGSSEEEATHWLVLDREQRKVAALPKVEAESFLQRQWPVENTILVVTPAEWEQISASVIERLQAQARKGVEQMLGRTDEAYRELIEWLDHYGDE